MFKILAELGRKMLGLALIFNSLVSLISASEILASFYVNRSSWQPYSPYLIDGSLFSLAVLTSILNIVPAKILGKAHIRRILFHHYVYGLLVFSASSSLIIWYMHVSLSMLFEPSFAMRFAGFQSLMFYLGLFFVYGGLTLVIDDLYDISLRMRRVLDLLKWKIYKLGRLFHIVHLCSSLISIYVGTCVGLWFLENCSWSAYSMMWNVSHVIFTSSLLVTGILGLMSIKKKLWFFEGSNLIKRKIYPS